MPKLASFDTKKVVLPSTESLPEAEQAVVTVKTKVSVKDVAAIPVVDGKLNASMSDLLPLVTSLIKGWNFTDDHGEVVPVTIENVGELDPTDFSAILTAVFNSYSLPKDDQKKSSPSLPPEEMAQTQA